jgi:hypothetical protein
MNNSEKRYLKCLYAYTGQVNIKASILSEINLKGYSSGLYDLLLKQKMVCDEAYNELLIAKKQYLDNK